MTTVEKAFEKYYPLFHEQWVDPLLDITETCENRRLFNLYQLLRHFPSPDRIPEAMTFTEFLMRKMHGTDDPKQALMKCLGHMMQPEEVKFIEEDTVWTEKLNKWRRIFCLLFSINN
jgi:hypothetical protein